MAPSWRDAILETLSANSRKRVAMDDIVTAVRRLPLGHRSDFEFHDRLRETLNALEREGYLQFPKARHLWDRQTGLPHYVTVPRMDAEDKQHAHRQALDALRNQTAWEPTHMVAFAHTLRTRVELARAVQVNHYLLQRPPDPVKLPHRERALEIFGDEKALDAYVGSGMFGGRITLDDLDCFYCPEPLPFRPFSLDPRETAGKPILIVENSNTYWSCCRANTTCHRYAAVVYGQGFAACAAERASDGLTEIQHQVAAAGIRYFGDLDPTGIAIPCRINRYREERGLPPLEAERILYRALLEKNCSVPYSRSQANDHDPALARRWLGQALASPYLANADSVRWPQEGLNFMDILDVLAVIIETTFDAESRRLMEVRRAVFVEEQGVPEALEQDERDPFCRHALLLRDGRPVATGRLADDGHIGRIAVLSTFRGRGLGSRMIRFLEEKAIANGLERVYLGAQLQAIPFYEKLGYRCYGDQFMDAGIPHRHMQKRLKGESLAKH